MKQLNYKWLFVMSLITVMSCDPGGEPAGCTDETRETFTMPTILEDYFGMYQEGNWWVYYNEDSTKVDSLYITDYEDEIVQAEFQCEQSIYNRYKINSTYLSPQSRPLTAEYIGDNCCDWTASWIYEDNGGFTITTINEDDESRIIFLSNFIERLANLQVGSNIYNDVLVMIISQDGDKVFFAKNIGLIRFRLDNEVFNLQKYNIE